MRIFYKGKDGGSKSTVTGYWLIEWKQLFSVCLLHFEGKSREAYHTHAFNAISWVIKGRLTEHLICGKVVKYCPSLFPIVTLKNRFHKVDSDGSTWVLTFRGPWASTWKEWLPSKRRFATLTHGRKEVC